MWPYDEALQLNQERVSYVRRPTLSAERPHGNESDQSHEAADLLSQPASTQTRYRLLDMDDIRKSFSKLKKDFKHRVGGKKRGTDRAGTNVDGDMPGSSLSLARPDSRVSASGRGEEESRIDTDASQTHSRDRSPQTKAIQADEGRDGPHGREADVSEKGASRSLLRLGPDVGDAAGSRPSREIKRGSSCTRSGTAGMFALSERVIRHSC